MPRTNRQNILLRHDQTSAALEKAIFYLDQLHKEFLPVHPEYAKGYEAILIMLTQAHEFVGEMKSHV